jgi:hypothetical protein
MNVMEFRDGIEKGLGRSILFLQDHPSKDYFDVILNACLHDTCYDAQCEYSRADYLFEVIRLTQEQSLFEDQILAEISVADDDWSIVQLLNLARLMAENGNDRARRIMYQYLKNVTDDNIHSFAEVIILLDGIDGLIFVAGVLGKRLINREGEGLWEDNYLIRLVKDKYGEEQTGIALQEAAQNDIRVKKYLEAVEINSQLRSRRDRKPLDYSEIQEMINEVAKGNKLLAKGNKFLNIRSYLLVWGKEASTEELEWIAADLLKETDENKLTRYLYIFLYREFPLNYSKLLDLALSQNEEVAVAAIKSLKNIRDSSIHDLAVSLIHKKLFYSEALELLVKNYQDNDYLLIEQVIEQEFDSDEFQDIASSIIKIFKHNPTPHSLKTILQIYQKGECSHCREKCVEIMISTKTMPHNIMEECHYDANPYIRKLVN